MQNIELLILNEQLVSSLYNIYARKFPEEKEFWLKKVNEENSHVQLLIGIQSIIENAPSYIVKEDRFSAEAINTSIVFIRELIEKAESFSLINALSMARDIENSLIEKDFFKIIPADPTNVKNAFSKIDQDTKRHRAEIQELWLKYVS